MSPDRLYNYLFPNSFIYLVKRYFFIYLLIISFLPLSHFCGLSTVCTIPPYISIIRYIWIHSLTILVIRHAVLPCPQLILPLNVAKPILTRSHSRMYFVVNPSVVVTGRRAQTRDMGGVGVAARGAAAARARPQRAPRAAARRSLRSAPRVRVRILHAKASRAARLGGILLGCAQVCSVTVTLRVTLSENRSPISKKNNSQTS